MTERTPKPSTVDEWANRKATQRLNAVGVDMTPAEAVQYRDGLLDLAALLLSDEAVEAAARSMRDVLYPEIAHLVPGEAWLDRARAALTAALTKITTNETEEKK